MTLDDVHRMVWQFCALCVGCVAPWSTSYWRVVLLAFLFVFLLSQQAAWFTSRLRSSTSYRMIRCHVFLFTLVSAGWPYSVPHYRGLLFKSQYKHESTLTAVPFGYLGMNQAQSICDTSWHWAAGQTAGGGTGLQITRRLQTAAIVLLHRDKTENIQSLFMLSV